MTLKELEKLAQECLAVQKDLADETKYVPYVVANDIHDRYFSALPPETVLKLISAIQISKDGLTRIDEMLRVPAAEYVPAISDAFAVIDSAKLTIESIVRDL